MFQELIRLNRQKGEQHVLASAGTNPICLRTYSDSDFSHELELSPQLTTNTGATGNSLSGQERDFFSNPYGYDKTIRKLVSFNNV